MKVGMNLLLWTAAAGEEHLGLIENIKAWGFDGVEFPMFDTAGSPWERLAQHLKDLEMGCTAVGVLPEDASLISEDSDARRRGVDFLKAAIDSCVTLGADTLAGPIYHPVGALVGRGPNEDERARAVECLQAVGEHAASAGIAVSVEPLNRFETYFVNCQADSRAITDAVGSGSVGILYDTFHANIEEKDIAAAIRTGGGHINHVHISANDRATPGEDHVDWATNFRTLKEVGYDGWLTIEAFGAWLPELAGATCIWRTMAPSEEHVAREGCKFVRASWGA